MKDKQVRRALEMFLDNMDKFGEWDEGCFYYNRTAAPELERPIQLARKALADKGKT